MFGEDSYGEAAFGEYLDRGSAMLVCGSTLYGATTTGTEQMLADESAEFVYCLELTVRSIAGDTTEVLYFATREWGTAPTDALANQPFDGRLRGPDNFRRSLLGGGRVGAMIVGGGSVVIDNHDGAFDYLADDYAVDGRQVVMKVGRVGDSYDSFLTTLVGSATGWTISADAVEVAVRDFGFRLDVPAQPDTYAGTGDQEGDENLIGKRKVKAFGNAFNITPVLIDAVNLIYDAGQTPVEPLDVPTLVYDRGASLSRDLIKGSYAALKADAVTAGEWSYYLQWFKLGSAFDGTISMIFRGVTFSGDPVADMIRNYLVPETDLVDPDEIDDVAFDAFDSGADTVDYYLDQDSTATVADVIEDVVAGVGGFCGFTPDGLLTIGLFDDPADGSIYAYYDETEIISLVRNPSPFWPPPWRIQVTTAWNWTVQTDIAGVVGEFFAFTLSQQYTLGTASDAAILADHPLAQDAEPIRNFTGPQDPALLAAFFLDLYGGERALYTISLPRRALKRRIGEVIHVTHSRFGLSAGKRMRIAEISQRAVSAGGDVVDSVEVIAFG